MDTLMDTPVLAALVIALILIALAAVWYFARRQKTERLRDRFGPEYERAVEKHRSQERAEQELTQREKRIEKYTIVPLPQAERVRYRETWEAVQSRFVDQPEAAVRDAHQLVQEVMRKCGYPMADFEQSAADLSVGHAHVVDNYRAAHRIAQRSERAAVPTEELRQALVHYRALFHDLLESAPVNEKETKSKKPWTRASARKDGTAHPNH
jgi:hypothetical protein